ncbi:AMP-binding protein [Pantoea stewartii]|uniref:AMP-binding protein n=1 Tax=Pantoea stewartii TaxID=66269 RepID=UPI0013DE63DE|nr:AMP-binding protein [Pantoea stewartii]QIE96984.1 AMP-binding protein [Pantoea stewartii]
MRFFSLPQGQDTAILFKNESFSRDRVRHLTHCLADKLLNHWPVTLHRVGMLVDPSPHQQITVLALHHAGITCVPLAKSLPKTRIEEITRTLNLNLIITDLPNDDVLGISIEQLFEDVNDYDEMVIPANIKADAECLVLHTSGSTGVPKAIALSWDNISSVVNAFTETPMFGSSSIANRICSFDFSVIETLPYLYHGRLLHIIDQSTRDSPRLLAEAILNSPAEVVAMTPSWFYEVGRQMVTLQNARPQYVQKKIIFGGEKIKYASLKAWWETFVGRHGCTVFNIYGPTECSVFVTWHQVTEADTRCPVAKIGEAFGDNSLCILDENNQRVTIDGQPGRLIVEGRSVAIGYLNTASDDRFTVQGAKRCYDTGDIVYREGHSYFIIGRDDNQVKVRGFRIDIDEITRNISAVDHIRDVHVSVLNNERTEHIVAFVTSTQPDIAEKVYGHLTRHLPEYALPNHICQVEHLPLNPNGKTDEHALRKHYDLALEEKNLRLLARRIRSYAFPSHYTLGDLHLTSLEIVELIIELEMAYGISLPTPDKTQLLYDLAKECEALPPTAVAHFAGTTVIPTSSRTLPSQGYYCDNYFRYQIRRDAVSVTLQFPEGYSEELLRKGIRDLLHCVPSLHLKIREQNGDFWQYDAPIHDEAEHYELEDSTTILLSKDFDFEAGNLFYFQLKSGSEGPQLTLHFAHVIVDGYACRWLINALLTILDGHTPSPVTPLHVYATHTWNQQPVDKTTINEFWARQSVLERPTKLFGMIPATVSSGCTEGRMKLLLCDYLPASRLSQLLTKANVSLHALVAYAVWRAHQVLCRLDRLEFHSPLGNRNRENHDVIANMITIVPFSISLPVEDSLLCQLIAMEKAIAEHIRLCRLSWAETAELTGRRRISLIVAESPKLFSDRKHGVHEINVAGPVIAKNALSFFYCSYQDGLHIDIRYNCSVAEDSVIATISKTLDRELKEIAYSLIDHFQYQ